MALADVLRERVSRRGRTAEVACGLLGTVTVEALPPRECAALGLWDGGRALFYAACRDLQTAGETLRREGRLFTAISRIILKSVPFISPIIFKLVILYFSLLAILSGKVPAFSNSMVICFVIKSLSAA